MCAAAREREKMEMEIIGDGDGDDDEERAKKKEGEKGTREVPQKRYLKTKGGGLKIKGLWTPEEDAHLLR